MARKSRGDGTEPAFWAASMRVLDAAVEKLTAAQRRSRGWKYSRVRRRRPNSTTGCLDDTVEAFRKFLVGIEGPLTTPIGAGIRSLNVAHSRCAIGNGM